MNAAAPLPPVTDGTVAPVHPALAALLRDGARPGPALTAFLAGNDSPLVEAGALTFFWSGTATEVRLLRWIHAGIDDNRFERLPGTDLWVLRLQVRDKGRFEYKLSVTGPEGEAWILDPRNPHRAGDPFGENSVAMTHGYERPAWTLPQGAPRGTLETLEVPSKVFSVTRQEKVYLPSGYDPKVKYPLVVIHDGGDYATYADLTLSLDNLIAAGDVPPLIAVLIQTPDRMGEYPRGRRHARHIVSELLPALTARYPISAQARDRVLLGASLGAVASLSTAFRYPGLFGGLILKSGSFILDREKLAQRPNPVFGRVARLVQVFRRAPGLPQTRAFLSTGELEGLADENRALADLLRQKGVEVSFQSSWDGHHWHNWRDQLRDALIWTLGPARDHS